MKQASELKHAWMFERRLLPFAIAHRGASHYAFDNSLQAFKKAAALGADFWEVDVRTTADGVLVAYHDPDLSAITGSTVLINELDYADLRRVTESQQQPIETLTAVLNLAQDYSAGIYLDAKDAAAIENAAGILTRHEIDKAIIAAFDWTSLQSLAGADSPFPLSVLVPLGEDPFALADASGADIIHLCWEHGGSRPQDLITDSLIAEADRRGLPIILWHEERIDVVNELICLPVMGICSNRPELLKPYAIEHPNAPAVVCHRGANKVCPENTLEAAECAFGAGYVVELDTHITADGELVVIHDHSLERTTNGSGEVCANSLAELRALDAGAWYDPFFRGTRVPLLSEMLDLAGAYQGELYIELKSAPVEDVLKLVLQKDQLAKCFFWSFDQHKLLKIRDQFVEARIMTRRKDYPTLGDTIAFANAQIIEFDSAVDDLSEIKRCQEAGCLAMVVINGADRIVFDQALALKPDYFNVNHPDVLRHSLRHS